MERKTFRNLVAVGMTVLGMMTTTAAFAGKDPDPMAGNRLVKTKSHKVIQSHINRIDAHKARINELKSSVRENRKTWKEDEMMSDKWLLKKERADLRREKCYLKTDKQAYLWEQKQAIKDVRKQRNQRQAEVRETKCKLRKDIRKGNTASAQERTEHLAILQRAVLADDVKLDRLKEDHENYVAYLNDEIRDADGETDVA